MMSKTFYNISLKTLKEAKEAHQRRIETEKKCRENIRLLEMYRNQFKEVFERYFHGTIKFFNESFDELERALRAELQKSIDENLEALKKIINI
ncbi:hypothetical protein HpHCM72_09950 [Helicobacter pylori]